MYDIEIDYTTGDSFHSERVTDCVGLVTNSLDRAKENLKRIKEHYKQYQERSDLGELLELTLLTDNEDRTIFPFWCGYFEHLHGAKIVTEQDSDMEFTI